MISLQCGYRICTPPTRPAHQTGSWGRDCNWVIISLDLSPAHSLQEGVAHVLVQGEGPRHGVGHGAKVTKFRKILASTCLSQEPTRREVECWVP